MSGEWCLIVATIGRTTEVFRLFATLPADPRVHIVVIDQNTDGRLDNLQDNFPHHRITHRRVAPEGVARARNHGLACVGDADFVAFPDDDCIYLPETLAVAEAEFALHPEYDALISGWSEIAAPINPADVRSPVVFNTVTKLGATNDTPTYNLFFRAAAIQRAGAFDTDLGLGAKTPWQSGEDTDFLLRAAGLHGTAGRTPAVWVQHPANPKRWPAGRAFAYGRGRTQLLRKHGFPLRTNLAMALHPLVMFVLPSEHGRRVRWDSFRGRIRELLIPYRPDRPAGP
jgi:hypothetical protein